MGSSSESPPERHRPRRTHGAHPARLGRHLCRPRRRRAVIAIVIAVVVAVVVVATTTTITTGGAFRDAFGTVPGPSLRFARLSPPGPVRRIPGIPVCQSRREARPKHRARPRRRSRRGGGEGSSIVVAGVALGGLFVSPIRRPCAALLRRARTASPVRRGSGRRRCQRWRCRRQC